MMMGINRTESHLTHAAVATVPRSNVVPDKWRIEGKLQCGVKCGVMEYLPRPLMSQEPLLAPSH